MPKPRCSVPIEPCLWRCQFSKLEPKKAVKWAIYTLPLNSWDNLACLMFHEQSQLCDGNSLTCGHKKWDAELSTQHPGPQILQCAPIEWQGTTHKHIEDDSEALHPKRRGRTINHTRGNKKGHYSMCMKIMVSHARDNGTNFFFFFYEK